MKRILKTTITSALVLSMALSGATAAVAATPAAEENCISASAVADWAENVKIKLFNKSIYAKYAPGVTVEKDENSPQATLSRLFTRSRRVTPQKPV